MATNKNAIIRYQTLDRCFRNPGRRYYINDLIDACNDALLELDPKSSGVKRRQVFDDIKFMRDPLGYDAPIESFKDGRQVYYRYDDNSFSINSQMLNEQEAHQLKETLMTLSRFKGLPQFDWVEEMKARLEKTFKFKSEEQKISFDDNIYLKGRDYIADLYNAIINKEVLEICYQSFKKTDFEKIVIHSYHLKQYNNRWFLFGLNNNSGTITNLALDRIMSIKSSKIDYINNTLIDFDEYFEDVVGVTVPNDLDVQKIILKIQTKLWPYIMTKPIHGSQKKKSFTETEVIIELRVKINYELIALLFSFMDAIEILEPIFLREQFKTVSENILSKYT